MKYRKILGYSWIGWLNIILLQWLFIRLQVNIDNDTNEIVKFRIIGPIFPLTGWNSPYTWVRLTWC